MQVEQDQVSLIGKGGINPLVMKNQQQAVLRWLLQAVHIYLYVGDKRLYIPCLLFSILIPEGCKMWLQ